MSILSDIRAGVADFKAGAETVVGWADTLYNSLPAPLHAAVDQEVAIAKQAASDAVGWADSAAKPVIDGAAETINTSFVQVVSGLGLLIDGQPGAVVAGAAARELQPFEIDAVNRARDALKAELDVEALRIKALLATKAPVVTSPASAAG